MAVKRKRGQEEGLSSESWGAQWHRRQRLAHPAHQYFSCASLVVSHHCSTAAGKRGKGKKSGGRADKPLVVITELPYQTNTV